MPMCPVCKDDVSRRLGAYRRRSDTLGVESVMMCDNCGLAFAFPLPSVAKVANYNRAYWQEFHGGFDQTKLAWVTDAGLNALRAEYLVEQAGQRLAPRLDVLEIGPGGGHLMRRLVCCLPIARYTVVESDRTCHDRLRQLGAHVFDDPTSLPASAQFHLIIISHVLEHVPDPVEFLSAVVARLVAGGCLFIETPCRDDSFKPTYDPHLLFFDKQPMRRLLERVGCEVATLTYHGPTHRELDPNRAWILRKADQLRTRWLEWRTQAKLASADIDDLSPQELVAYVSRFHAGTSREEPCWWLRSIAFAPNPRPQRVV